MNPGKPSKAGKSRSTDTPADMDYLLVIIFPVPHLSFLNRLAYYW